MSDPTPEQVEAAAVAICEAFPHAGGGSRIDYEGAEAAARAALVAAASAAPKGQIERVSTRLREIVYLCGDGLGCQCEEAEAGAIDLARELSIVAAGEPAFTAEKVWALAKVLHDEAGDTDNVPAFAASLAGSLRASGVAFDEEPFVSVGLLTARATGDER